MRRALLLPIFLLTSWSCFGQEMPSKEEINELAAKANEKVTVFEQALERAKPFIDEAELKKYSEAASTAHMLIRTLQSNGPSAYRLVVLVITMDDLVIDARVIASNLLITAVKVQAGGKTVPAPAISAVNALDEAASACTDIAELIGHATLRLISVEEQLIEKIAK
jgi:hypothetical protein